jgi:SpoVK/Ycf46/Vps4 family AAA+-type ATPase
MIEDQVEELRGLIGAGWRLIAMESIEEERALALLNAVARSCARECRSWTLGSGLGLAGQPLEQRDENASGSLSAGLAAMERCTEPAVFVLHDAHRILDDPVAVRRLRDLLPHMATRLQCVVLLAPVLPLPSELEREAARVELPLPTSEELERLFRRIHRGIPAEGEEDPISEEENFLLLRCVRGSLGLTASESKRVFRKACSHTGGLVEATVDEVVREKRRVLGRTAALSFHEDDSALNDVGGLSELKKWLRERGRAFGKKARDFGLPIPRGLLLLGVQGCGKSLSAKAVAREWQFPLLRLDLAAAFGSNDMSPEIATREAMRVAEALAPVVLWIDEIEKGLSATGGDARSARVFGAFLTWLSEKRAPVFVVATANDVTGLPPELLRRGRFDELFFVDLPSAAEREEILAIHLEKRGRDPQQFRLDELAEQSERLSGAELEQVVASALYSAFSRDRDLEHDDLSDAITEAVPLYDTYEERIKELRDWARHRARPASVDAKVADYFATRD